mmetsp:Transcript_36556/g.70166  ORF Transcript_36556/g.70166 Transcript_36556/m.70166 type:complete len:274 (+) Transcript_36556:4315-5136(+)
MMAISRSFTSSSACRYLAVASDASAPYFSRSFSSWYIILACFCASTLYPWISCSRFFLVFSLIFTRSIWRCVAFSACVLSLLRMSRSRISSSCFLRSSSDCLRPASSSRSNAAISPLSSTLVFSSSWHCLSTALSLFSVFSRTLFTRIASILMDWISSSFTLSSTCFWEFSARSCVLVWIWSSKSWCSFCTFSLRLLYSFCTFSVVERCSFSICSSRAIWSSPCATRLCFCLISDVRCSSVCFSSFISFSMRSFLRSSLSPSARLAAMESLSW